MGQNAGNINKVPFISLKDVGCGNNWGSPSDPQIVYCQFDTDLLDGLEDMGPVDSITVLLMGTNEQETSVLIGKIFLMSLTTTCPSHVHKRGATRPHRHELSKLMQPCPLLWDTKEVTNKF